MLPFFESKEYDSDMFHVIRINEKNKESYNKVAKHFSATRSYLWHDLTPFIDYIQDGDKVLDVGCGNGRLLSLLKGKSVKYLGVDFSENLIAEAKQKNPGSEFKVLDIHELGKLGERFDVVFCVSVLNHFPFKDQKKIIQNIGSVLKTGGHLLLVNWNMWNLGKKKNVWKQLLKNPVKFMFRGGRGIWTKWQGGSDVVDLYYYAFNKKHLRNLLKSNGFEVIKNYYSHKGGHSSWLFGDNIVTVARFCSSELERRQSKIHGYGIFTKRDIFKGETFYYIPLTKLSYHNYKRYAYIGNGQYVNDQAVLNWVNHSCNANVRLDINRPDPVLVALRDINADEEITCNYDITEEVGVYRKCLCKEGTCKGHFGQDKNLKAKMFS
jgi:2-polyprenyl-3-methyl-5-hydroxy-6-metoxy-1,4-benzoquinol methylase